MYMMRYNPINKCWDYPTTPEIKVQLPITIKYSVGGIRIKILDKISYYEHNDDGSMGYKKSALKELYDDLFGLE